MDCKKVEKRIQQLKVLERPPGVSGEKINDKDEDRRQEWENEQGLRHPEHEIDEESTLEAKNDYRPDFFFLGELFSVT